MTTLDKIKAIQRHLGLAPDGQPGMLTWSAIYTALGIVGAAPEPLDGMVDARSAVAIETLHPHVRPKARALIAQAAKVGIKASIVKYEWAEYLKRAKDGESAIGMFGWNGDNGDPDNFLATLLSCAAVGGSNYAQWCDKEYDALVVKAKRTSNQAERAKLYEKAQEVFHREAPWVPMAHSVVYQPMLKTVQGYRMSPFGAVQFFGVSLK